MPYLSGERTPHNDPNAQGVLFGLNHETDAAAIAQAVLEGVAFAFRDGMDALLATGAKIESIAVIGGGARSAYWGRILSSVLRRSLTYRDSGAVGPAFGAARLARMGAEKSSIEDICTPPPILHVAEPDDRLADLYVHKMKRYRGLYQNLKDSISGDNILNRSYFGDIAPNSLRRAAIHESARLSLLRQESRGARQNHGTAIAHGSVLLAYLRLGRVRCFRRRHLPPPLARRPARSSGGGSQAQGSL